MVELRGGQHCSTREIAACLPPNTADLNAFCDGVCRQHGRSIAVISGYVPGVLCEAISVLGASKPKGKGVERSWNDAACTGSCTVAVDGGCNSDGDCGMDGGSCTTSCAPVVCTSDGGSASDSNNFCLSTTGPSCCNSIPIACTGDKSGAVCRPGLGDPPGILTGVYSQVTKAGITPGASMLTLTFDDGTTATAPASGEMTFSGTPCSGPNCSLGVTFVAFIAPFTVKGATFSGMSISGGTMAPDLQLVQGPGGYVGTLDADRLSITAQGTSTASILKICVPGTNDCTEHTVGGTKAVYSTPQSGVASVSFSIDYASRTWHMSAPTGFRFPGTADVPAFTIALSWEGSITNLPPVAVVAGAVSVPCDSRHSGTALLDGRASFDGDHDVLTWSWVKGSPIVGEVIGEGARFSVVAPFQAPGPITTLYTMQVTEPGGQTGTAPVAVTVSDTTGPAISGLSVSPSCLWSPNHKWVRLRLGSELNATAQDLCDATPTVLIKSVVSSESSSGGGQGSFSPDVRFGPRAVCLRAERQGTGQGRQYTISVAARDASGNETTRAVVVSVGHDQHGQPCDKTSRALEVEENDPSCVAP